MLTSLLSPAFKKSLTLFGVFHKRYWYLSHFYSVFFSLVTLINVAFEMATLIMIWPLIGLVLDPAQAAQSIYAKFLVRYTPFDAKYGVLFAMAALCGVYVAKNLFILLVNVLQAKVFARWKERLATQVYDKLLHAPYAFHNARSSTDLAQIVIFNVPYVLNQFVDQLFLLAGNIVMCVTIVTFVLYVLTPYVLIGVGAGVLMLVLQHFAMRGTSRRIGQTYLKQSSGNMSILNQTFHAFKEVQMYQVYQRFSADFRQNMHGLSQTEKWLRFFEKLPALANEIVLVCIMLVCMLLLSRSQNEGGSAFQQMGMLVLAFFRLIPTLNQISNSLIMLNSASVPLESFLATMDELEHVQTAPAPDAPGRFDGDFAEIAVRSLTHAFAPGVNVLRGVSLRIKRGGFTVLTGASGSGKSTLLNIVMGFIQPDHGGVYVNDTDIRADLRSWQKRIAIVMQDFYIFDSSLAENVAFGIVKDEIDVAKVERALAQVELDELHVTKPDGIWMPVGENGKLLSGGQRQRVALARALYFDKDVWILDEVTSSLDLQTERRILEIIKNLTVRGTGRRITVIMSAHRSSVLPYSDAVVMLKDGGVLAEGAFDDLLAHNETFRDMYVKQDKAAPAAAGP